jgi:hypothetical protein
LSGRSEQACVRRILVNNSVGLRGSTSGLRYVDLVLFLVAIARAIIGPGNPFGGWDMLHAFGALAVAVLLVWPFEAASKYLHDKEFVRLVAYAADFHEAASYPGVLPKERVRLHENGIVSSAVIVSGKVIITTEKRNF